MVDVLVKDAQTLLEDMIRVYKSGLQINVGIENPSVDPGSSAYVLFQTVANEVAVGLQQISVKADSQMIDTATGDDLDRFGEIYGAPRRSAKAAGGFIELDSTKTVLIPTGSQLISAEGLIYEVVVGGSYSDGDSIEVVSIDFGGNTNLDEGEILTWVSTPPFSSPTVDVISEITGGSDTEDDETLRNRIYAILQNPPQFGNWSDVANLSESFDSAVQKSFIYPGADGYGTQHIAVTAYTTASDKTRDLPSTNLTNLTSSITGSLPAYTRTTVTTVDNVNFDLSLNISIPFPIGAPNLGTGGGWLNYNPFPLTNVTGASHDGTTNFAFSYVSSVTSSTSFVIKAPSDLTVFEGVTKISWINKSNDWTIVTATIQSVSISSNDYTIEIDQPFVGIAANDWIFPAMEKGQDYLDNILDYFALLGPGEKTSESTLIANGMALRKPRQQYEFPSAINSKLSKYITNNNTEVLDVDFNARRTGGAEVGGANPDLPDTINDAPKIYIPNNIGFYPDLS